MAITTPDIPPVTGGVQLFRSCLVSTEYPGVESASKWLFERFDVEYIVNPDQTCCTGLGYYSDMIPFPTPCAISARNACVAVDAGHPVQSYLCSTCYAINKKSRDVLAVPEYRARTNEVLATIGREYTDEVASTIRHMHTLEVLWSRHHSIPGLIKRRLDGIKVATHPACHYCKVFPDEVTGDAENFMIPEDLLAPTGIISTGNYPEKTNSCGAGFRQRFVNPAISQGWTRLKMKRLKEQGIDVCVHMCPLCGIQFDRHHATISAIADEEYPFVHLHVQQLLAMALGADPDLVCGVEAHSQDVEPILARIGARDRDKVAIAVGDTPLASEGGAS